MASGQNAAAERVATWVKSLGQSAGADTTLRFAPSTSNSIDITHANPSGLAQFLAGRRTRLSTLLHDAEQYATARRTARALASKISELWEERGIDVGYLAAGVANWRAVHEGKSEPVSAPIMLGRITLTKHVDADDYDLRLVGRATVSPAFVRQFEADHNATVDVSAVDSAAYSIARFDPVRGMDALRHQMAEVPGVVVGHRLLLSTFSELMDPADPAKLTGSHPVIEALIRQDLSEKQAKDSADSKASEALANLVAAKPGNTAAAMPETDKPAGDAPEAADAKPEEAKSAEEGSSRLRRVRNILKDSTRPRKQSDAGAVEEPSTRKVHTGSSTLVKSSDERDPEDELYLLDADESQSKMLDYVAAGESVAINAAAGTGATQTALNAAALLAAQGKRVLVVAEQRSAAEEFVKLFNEQLDAASLLLEPNEDPEQLRTLLTKAILRNEKASEPRLGSLFKRLRESRHAPHEHVKSPHSVRGRWGCSPYQAMQELARLSALEPAPSTTVRLKRSVLDSMGRPRPCCRAAQARGTARRVLQGAHHQPMARCAAAQCRSHRAGPEPGQRPGPRPANSPRAHGEDRQAVADPAGRQLRQVGRPAPAACRRARFAGQVRIGHLRRRHRRSDRGHRHQRMAPRARRGNGLHRPFPAAQDRQGIRPPGHARRRPAGSPAGSIGAARRLARHRHQPAQPAGSRRIAGC
ncbi:DUF4011 domain-containing protein [Glutamicibacter halophytocola]|uniref:DUF4011 domain-containing protein n=1 Tax=Glutamicibacter halophytocola TaxID=1933880 RepID=UPI00321B2FAE